MEENNTDVEFQNEKLKSKYRLCYVIAFAGIILSLSILIILGLLSATFPAPIFHQLLDGSWRVGLMGFIEYHCIEGILYY